MAAGSTLTITPDRQYAPLDQPTPFRAGLENEFGITIWDFDRELIKDYIEHGFFNDESGPGEEVHSIATPQLAVIKRYLPPGVVEAQGFLSNGMRYYTDQSHPELATGECGSIRELLLTHAAGEMLVYESFERARQAGVLGGFVLNTRLIDGEYNTWGAHENYLIPRGMSPDTRDVYMPLATHFAARQIFTSAYDLEQHHLSQRGKHFVELASNDTTRKRPIVNTRDEPHANILAWRRLHVINADATMLPGATALKVGMANIVNRLITHGVNLDHLYLFDPVDTFRKIGSDMTLSEAYTMEDGWKMTALDMEEEFVTLAQQLDQRADVFTDEERTIMNWQERLIGEVRQNPTHEPLVGISDWAHKFDLIEHRPDRAKKIDFNWGWIDPNGLATVIREKGACVMPFDFSMDAAREYVTRAPEGRAAKRGRIIAQIGEWGLKQSCRNVNYAYAGIIDPETRIDDTVGLDDVLGIEPTDEQIDKWISRVGTTIENIRASGKFTNDFIGEGKTDDGELYLGEDHPLEFSSNAIRANRASYSSPPYRSLDPDG